MAWFAGSVAQGAAGFTPQQIAEFLEDIGLGQYSQSFLDQEMNGEMMLEVRDNDLADFGVKSRLHQAKIVALFQRLVSGGATARFGQCGQSVHSILCTVV